MAVNRMFGPFHDTQHELAFQSIVGSSVSHAFLLNRMFGPFRHPAREVVV